MDDETNDQSGAAKGFAVLGGVAACLVVAGLYMGSGGSTPTPEPVDPPPVQSVVSKAAEQAARTYLLDVMAVEYHDASVRRLSGEYVSMADAHAKMKENISAKSVEAFHGIGTLINSAGRTPDLTAEQVLAEQTDALREASDGFERAGNAIPK